MTASTSIGASSVQTSWREQMIIHDLKSNDHVEEKIKPALLYYLVDM